MLDEFNRKKSALDSGLEEERLRQKKLIEEKLAQRKAARLKKIQQEEDDLSKEIEGVDQEIGILNGLSQPA